MDVTDNTMMPQPAPVGAPPKMIDRDPVEPSESRAALVKQWSADIREAKRHWKKDFDRMRRDMKFANGRQWHDETDDDQRYKANLVQREIKSMVSALYAKNPTVVIGRRKRLDFQIWDGRPETAQTAMMVVQQAQQVTMQAQAGMPVPPGAIDPQGVAAASALLADIQQGSARRQMIDKLGDTLVCLADYFTSEGTPTFKMEMKRMVRRARTTGVGYVKLGFQRAMELSDDQEARINDMAGRLAVIGQLTADIQDGETDPNAAEAEELRLAIQTIQSEPEAIVREGVVFSFPTSTRLIPSISTECVVGWVGSEWVAEEVMLSPDKIKQIYGVDIGASYTAYKPTDGQSASTGEMRRTTNRNKSVACVYHVYDKNTGMELVICEGYADFLKEPGSPPIFIEQFFPYFTWAPNLMESEGEIFPKSDVTLTEHIQREYNRSKEALRQHRIANRPLYLAPDGAFEEEEEKALSEYPAHAVIKLHNISGDRKAGDLLQPVQKIGVDPNLYETGTIFEDMQRVTGNQEANLGGTSSSTATESNIAEQSRMGTLSLDGDDLDDMLSLLYRAMSQVMLTEIDEATVQEIVGVGAVWPTLSRSDIMKELWLETKAGSSGRPNQARDAATLERMGPLLLQIPGIPARWLAERAVRIADDGTDLEDAYIEGLPSIMAQNRMAQVAQSSNPGQDPNQQGPEGGDNGKKPAPAGGSPQPGFPGPGAGGSAMQ